MSGDLDFARVNAVAGEARSGGELPPRIAIAPAKGRATPELIVVWRARRERTSLLLSRSTDGGRTFDHLYGRRAFQSVLETVA